MQDGKNYASGRWTEKEHYLFLLAVKDHGRDWKKIEEYVVTRSSTQARSHAQKVLKDDMVNSLDDEIQRLSKIYDKAVKSDKESSNAPSTKSNSQKSKNISKAKNKRKNGGKQIIEKLEAQEIIQKSSSSSICSEKANESVSYYDNSSEYSEYSYPDESNTKLFSIEKTKKRNVNLRKRKAKGKIMAPVKEAKVEENRKASSVTNASGWTSNTTSPIKVKAPKASTPSPDRQNLPNKIKFRGFQEEGWCTLKDDLKNEDDQEEKIETINKPDVNKTLKRGLSFQEREDEFSIINPQLPLSCKPVSHKFKKSLLPNMDEANDFVHKTSLELNELSTNIFDIDLDLETQPPSLTRKMTHDAIGLQSSFFDEMLLLGDRKFPLFDQY